MHFNFQTFVEKIRKLLSKKSAKLLANMGSKQRMSFVCFKAVFLIILHLIDLGVAALLFGKKYFYVRTLNRPYTNF